MPKARLFLGQNKMASQDHWKFQRAVLWSATLDHRTSGLLAPYIPATFDHIRGESATQLINTVKQMDSIAPNAIYRRLELGRQCFTMQVDGSIAAYGWLTCGVAEWVGELERELNVLHDEGYIWDCATLPAYRQQRLFSALISHVTAHLQDEGLQRLWIIGNNSAPSLARNMQDIGFKPIISLMYIRLLGIRTLLTTAHRGADTRHVKDGRRLLKGDHDKVFGPLIVGNSSRQKPPDTHFDG